jgi:hypothetical protein
MLVWLSIPIFVGLSATCWFVGLAIYRGFRGDDDLKKADRAKRAFYVIGIQAELAYIPFPLGYLLTLVVLALASWLAFEKPTAKVILLFLILGTLNYVLRLATLGVLTLIG